MSDGSLPQTDADRLRAMEKRRVNEDQHDFPYVGGALAIPLASLDGREEFVLDVTRGRINLSKVTYQNRARTTVVLARLDLGGPPHRNPDDQEVPCPHLHLYREGYADKWAFALTTPFITADGKGWFHDLTDLWKALEEFMRFCNITEPPHIERGLFT